MQKKTERTNKLLLLSTENQLFEKIVSKDHPFRKLAKTIEFEELIDPLRDLYSDLGKTGVDIERGFKALLVQFWEDYSDRQMESALRENMAVRWFCGFGLTEETPKYSYFSKLRKRLGSKRIADIFNSINDMLATKGLFGNVFKFIDASSVVTKTALWEERDKAIKDGEEKLNNAVVSKYAKDKDARWGAKNKNTIWFGYKRHHTVDMRYGLIEKITVTPANVLDFQVLENICPKNCMVFMDKLYDTKGVENILRARHCHNGIIKKRSNKEKNKDLDKWRSKTRMPFEGSFSKLRKRAKFRGRVKVLMQCYMESICHNLKKAVVVLP